MLRSDPDKARAWQQRSRKNLTRRALLPGAALRVRSPRKKDRYDAIADACRRAVERDGRCMAVDLLPAICCAGRIEGHHLKPRSTAPKLVADVDCVLALCSAHHAYVTDHPVEARSVGLHGFYGDTLAALAQVRREKALQRPQGRFGGSAGTTGPNGIG